MAFQEVEDELRDILLPFLFQEAMYQIPGRSINGLPVNQANIDLPDPNQTCGVN